MGEEADRCEHCGKRGVMLTQIEFQGEKSPALCEECWREAMRKMLEMPVGEEGKR